MFSLAGNVAIDVAYYASLLKYFEISHAPKALSLLAKAQTSHMKNNDLNVGR
ncbi:MAG: hypothetical protein V4724_30345 [Pseudomonadota bacterium]